MGCVQAGELGRVLAAEPLDLRLQSLRLRRCRRAVRARGRGVRLSVGAGVARGGGFGACRSIAALASAVAVAGSRRAASTSRRAWSACASARAWAASTCSRARSSAAVTCPSASRRATATPSSASRRPVDRLVRARLRGHGLRRCLSRACAMSAAARASAASAAAGPQPPRHGIGLRAPPPRARGQRIARSRSNSAVRSASASSAASASAASCSAAASAWSAAGAASSRSRSAASWARRARAASSSACATEARPAGDGGDLQVERGRVGQRRELLADALVQLALGPQARGGGRVLASCLLKQVAGAFLGGRKSSSSRTDPAASPPPVPASWWGQAASAEPVAVGPARPGRARLHPQRCRRDSARRAGRRCGARPTGCARCAPVRRRSRAGRPAGSTPSAARTRSPVPPPAGGCSRATRIAARPERSVAPRRSCAPIYQSKIL